MRTQTQTHTPQPPSPPPPPPPPKKASPPAVPLRRHRATSSSSSVSTATSASSSSAASSPSPSPSPRTSSTTSVPFSWEHHPGIPKNSLAVNPASPPAPLPLPPPLRRRPARPGPAADPFAAALAECTREDASGGGADAMDATGRTWRRWSLAASWVVGFLDLHGCKSAMAVADGAFLVRRPVAARVESARAGQARSGRIVRR